MTDKLSKLEDKLSSDFLKHIESGILLNKLDNDLIDKLFAILNIEGLDSLDKNSLNISN